jgi:hypothetical protein
MEWLLVGGRQIRFLVAFFGATSGAFPVGWGGNRWGARIVSLSRWAGSMDSIHPPATSIIIMSKGPKESYSFSRPTGSMESIHLPATSMRCIFIASLHPKRAPASVDQLGAWRAFTASHEHGLYLPGVQSSGWLVSEEKGRELGAGGLGRERDGVELGLLDWQMDRGCQSKVSQAWIGLADGPKQSKAR